MIFPSEMLWKIWNTFGMLQKTHVLVYFVFHFMLYYPFFFFLKSWFNLNYKFFSKNDKCNALCNICNENPQIMLQKTWSNFTFSTLYTCDGPKRCPKANVQISLNVLYLPEYPILGEISCLALPEKSYLLRFGKIRLATTTRSSI